ncbi:helix-turn-helix domain-containing protein [Agrobacterium tumefaciens]
MDNTQKLLMSVKEAVEATGLCKATLYKHIKIGTLKYVKLGNRTLFRPVDLQEFVNGGLQVPA